MKLDFTTFRRIVRPTREVPLEVAPDVLTEEPVLLYGEGVRGVDEFARVAPLVGWGSAVVLLGVPTESAEVVDRAEEIARANTFRHWFRGRDIPEFPDDTRTWVKSEYDGQTYSTHLPYLLEAVRRTVGPVLELGAGNGSTPALHDVCTKAGRLLVTVDSDQLWLNRYADLGSELHKFEFCSDPAETIQFLDEWGVVFVDHAPGETRGKAVERARDRAEYVVAHDTEDLGYNLEELLSTFKYRRDFRRSRPWTTVVSMTKEIWK